MSGFGLKSFILSAAFAPRRLGNKEMSQLLLDAFLQRVCLGSGVPMGRSLSPGWFLEGMLNSSVGLIPVLA